jgi:hypothetical protein
MKKKAVEKKTPIWQKMLLGVIVTLGAATVACVAFCAFS